MAALSFIVGYLAIGGAFVSWCAAVYFFLKTHAHIETAETRWMALAAWPFAFGRLSGAARGNAVLVNKALAVFFLCLFVAIGAFGASFVFAAAGN